MHLPTNPCLYACIHATMHPFTHASILHLLTNPCMHPSMISCLHESMHASTQASMHPFLYQDFSKCSLVILILCWNPRDEKPNWAILLLRNTHRRNINYDEEVGGELVQWGNTCFQPFPKFLLGQPVLIPQQSLPTDSAAASLLSTFASCHSFRRTIF